MANWRKQQGESQHQMGHQLSSSYYRKPPLYKWSLPVPQWEKNFCESVGSMSWEKIMENKKYMHLYQNVCQWDDSAGKDAFDNAKMRYWADINRISCNISLPDPNIFIDEIDWNASDNPKLVLEAEYELVRVYPEEYKEDNKIEIVEGNLYVNGKKLPCTGWEDDADPVSNPYPCSAVQGEGAILQENNVVENGLKDFDPVEHAKKYEQNNLRTDLWHSNNREHCGGGGGGDWHKMGRGRNGGYGNCENGYHIRGEHNSWSKTPLAYKGNDEYHMKGGRRNYRGGGGRGGRRRGNFVYVPKQVNPTPTPAAW